MLAALLARYTAHLQLHPVRTNAATGFVTASVGDLACQLLIEKSPYSARRTLEMGTARAGFFGPFLTVWYPLLLRFSPGTSTAHLLRRVLVDQTVGAPIAIAATLSLVAALQGHVSAVPARLSQSFLETWMTGLLFWPIVNFYSFRSIAVSHQPIFAHSIAIGWNCFLSRQANSALLTAPAATVPQFAAGDGATVSERASSTLGGASAVRGGGIEAQPR